MVETNKPESSPGAIKPEANPWEIKRPATAGDTILVRVTGPDRPGITARLMQVLSTSGAGMHDVEQILIRGRLTLSLIITVPEGHYVLRQPDGRITAIPPHSYKCRYVFVAAAGPSPHV